MIVDGQKIAESMYSDLARRVSLLQEVPRLTVFTCAPNFETKKYLELKKSKAKRIGIYVNVVEVNKKISTKDLMNDIEKSASTTDGIIVQLPLPDHIDKEQVFASIPILHDVDSLNPKTQGFLSPVVGAIKVILETCSINIKDKNIVVIGNGKLVGAPTFKWFSEQDTNTQAVTSMTPDISQYTKEADIIVSGAGVPKLIKPNMIKKNSVILDAGTSEDGGELRGDADPECASKCSFFTPVPGGIGPIAIAVLLQNVVDSVSSK